MCREEASQLSSLQPELAQLGIPLVGIVHQKLGADNFKPYLKGDLFLDAERKFYGPKERWMFLTGFLRVGVWKSMWRARGVDGNFEGEGRLLGGVFVIGPQDQGVLLEHKEKEFGDHVDLKDVRDAVQRIKTTE